MPHNVDGLKPYEKQLLIDWFMYYMKGDTRTKLMHEFPGIYNTLCDRKIMQVSLAPQDLDGQ